MRTAASLNPDRVIWIDGDLDIDTGGDIGSAAEPLVLVVTGNLTFSTPANVFGLVYSRAADWVSSGAGVIRGAAVAETRLSGSATTDIVYDTAILNHLRLQSGSFILVPGSWRDFE